MNISTPTKFIPKYHAFHDRRVGKAIVLTWFFMAGYGWHRKLGVGFRMAGYGRHGCQWVKDITRSTQSVIMFGYSAECCSLVLMIPMKIKIVIEQISKT